MKNQIKRIISIKDTRQYEESGDKWVPIRGSGDSNECFRCGRFHEVHALVELGDGKQVIVGTGCAGRDNVEMDAQFRSLDAAAKRLARLKAEHVGYLAKCAAYDAAWLEVLALAVPSIEKTEGVYQVGREAGQKYPSLTCGDATVRCWTSGYTQERFDCVLAHWRHNRMMERGFQFQPRALKNYAKEIANLESKLNPVSEAVRVQSLYGDKAHLET